MNWWFINSGPSESAFNMALDEALLESVSRLGAPGVLRFMLWSQPAATFVTSNTSPRSSVPRYCVRSSAVPPGRVGTA